jgi:hypothetical protein
MEKWGLEVKISLNPNKEEAFSVMAIQTFRQGISIYSSQNDPYFIKPQYNHLQL